MYRMSTAFSRYKMRRWSSPNVSYPGYLPQLTNALPESDSRRFADKLLLTSKLNR